MFLRNEQRVRHIEARSGRLSGEAAQDLKWLVGELRRSREALLSIMTVAQEGEDNDELLKRIRFSANEALGMYPNAPVDD